MTASPDYIPTSGNAARIPAGADAWLRTIRNAWSAASDDDHPRIVGATYSTFFITADADSVEARQHGQLRVDPDGSVWRIKRDAA